MPKKTEWVPNEKFLFFGGVTVYRTYIDDDIEKPSEFFFTLDPDSKWADTSKKIDVRKSSFFKTTQPPEEQTDLKNAAVIIQMISSGRIGNDQDELDKEL